MAAGWGWAGGAVSEVQLRARARGVYEEVPLSWHAAEDNVAPMAYVISRADGDGFKKIAESRRTSYLDTGDPKGECRYRGFAIDFEENLGPWSDPAKVNSTSTRADPDSRAKRRIVVLTPITFGRCMPVVGGRSAGITPRCSATR